MVHLACFQGIVMRKNKLHPLPGGNVACTKKCYSKAAKELAGGGDDMEGGRKGNWDGDGMNGPDDILTSMRVLLDWWMTEGNYSKFCGKHNDGVKKREFCNTLALTMNSNTRSKRDAKNVLSKIQHVEKRWREAHNFATSETGAGIKEKDGDEQFRDIVLRKCPYYWDLLDVMQDRASSAPKLTSYDDDDEEDEEGEDNDQDVYDDHESSVSDVSDDQLSAASVTVLSVAATSIAGGGGGASFTPTASVVTKRTTSSSQVSSNKKKKRPPKRPDPLMDESIISILESTTKASQERAKELARHNKVMEAIKSNKTKWQGKNDELHYKMSLLGKYKEMRDDFAWTDAQILRFCPDMKLVIDAGTDSD
jgi:hypothetical protein